MARSVGVGAVVALAASGVLTTGESVGLLADDRFGLAHPTSDPITSNKAKMGAIFKGGT